MKKLFYIFILLLFSSSAFAVINYPLENRTADPVFEWSLDLTSGKVVIARNGPAHRQQMPDLQATSCTFQSVPGNRGNIYLGDATVTNAAGRNEGLHVGPSGSISNVTVNGNTNKIWIAGDHVGDVVKYLCN